MRPKLVSNHNHTLFEQAQKHLPGGVNSPVRAFRGVGGTPVFLEKAEGSRVYDVDGRAYLDYVGSWGPMILGHNHPAVVAAVHRQIDLGMSFGAPTRLETEMADRLCQLVPSLDMVRMVNSGTEATMSAIRLARGYTGRDRIVKFQGCYHGHSDSLLVEAGSGALTLGVPSSPGVPADLARHTITASFNHLADVERIFAEQGEQIACIIVEPVAGNMNCVPPVPGFLPGLRELCNHYGALLIFDEVMTGFRVALGGAQQRYDITPDLTTLGKIVGGGMPVGAFGGRRDIMEQLAPLGPVYQAGTLSGNPVAMAAGLAVLAELCTADFYRTVESRLTRLLEGFKERAKAAGLHLLTRQAGAMCGLFFTDQQEVNDFKAVMACNSEQFGRFFHAMLAEGVYFAPSPFEASFISAAHTDRDIEQTLAAAEKVFAKIG